MKKVLTIILTVVMLLGVLAVNTSAASPSVSIVTNEGSAVDSGKDIYITIKFNDFSSIKGMDVIVASDKENVLETVELITGFQNTTPAEGENFTVNAKGNEIRFVDLTGSKAEGKIVIKATAPATTANITVTGKYAQTGATLFGSNLEINKNLEVKIDVEEKPLGTATNNTYTIPVDTKKKFVPYGSVFKNVDGKTTFADKTSATTFTVKEGDTATYSYKEFDLPSADVGITTYGVSEDPFDSTKLRFGSYSQNLTETSEHGTMVFEGNFLALKNYYIKNGYTVEQFVKAIYNDASSRLSTSGKKFVYYNIPDINEQINVYLFPQNNYMWKEGAVLEFAVRLSGIQEDTEYAAVAYSVDGQTLKISKNVKSFKVESTQN